MKEKPEKRTTIGECFEKEHKKNDRPDTYIVRREASPRASRASRAPRAPRPGPARAGAGAQRSLVCQGSQYSPPGQGLVRGAEVAKLGLEDLVWHG